DAVIDRVRDVEQAVRPQGQAADSAELARGGAHLAPRLDYLAARVQFRDPFAQVELGDVIIAIRVLNRIADVAILPWLGPRRAGEDWQFLALGRIDAQAVVVRIADDQVAVAVDAETRRPADAEVGRRPGRADVVAIEVEDLDACRVIDDVEPIAWPDRRGP